jgi:PAS domain-containing protein
MLVNLSTIRTVTAKSNEAVFVINADHKIEYWDDNAEKLYEVSKEEALGAKANQCGKYSFRKFS